MSGQSYPLEVLSALGVLSEALREAHITFKGRPDDYTITGQLLEDGEVIATLEPGSYDCEYALYPVNESEGDGANEVDEVAAEKVIELIDRHERLIEVNEELESQLRQIEGLAKPLVDSITTSQASSGVSSNLRTQLHDIIVGLQRITVASQARPSNRGHFDLSH